jgi:hypothetical protein
MAFQVALADQTLIQEAPMSRKGNQDRGLFEWPKDYDLWRISYVSTGPESAARPRAWVSAFGFAWVGAKSSKKRKTQMQAK